MNGTCNTDTNTCFVYSWCPVDLVETNRNASVYITEFPELRYGIGFSV